MLMVVWDFLFEAFPVECGNYSILGGHKPQSTFSLTGVRAVDLSALVTLLRSSLRGGAEESSTRDG